MIPLPLQLTLSHLQLTLLLFIEFVTLANNPTLVIELSAIALELVVLARNFVTTNYRAPGKIRTLRVAAEMIIG